MVLLATVMALDEVCAWETVDFRVDNTSFRYLEHLRDVEVGRTQEEQDVAVHW